LDYRDRIGIDPTVRFGKPIFKGTRIAVADILEYMAGGDSEDDVVKEFPQLSIEDDRACLAFAADRDRHLRIA
jgi:uncharacterized protein (DUF433 family)